jgi:hypothetical protein
MGNFEIGTCLFLGSLEYTFEIVNLSEKAICVKNENGKNYWIPKSGLQIQKRHPLLHETTPDTYKIADWVNVSL